MDTMEKGFDINKFLDEISLEKKIYNTLKLNLRILEEQGEVITRKMTIEEIEKYNNVKK